MPSRQLKSGRRLDDASFLAVVIVSMNERERESNNPVVRARRTNGTADDTNLTGARKRGSRRRMKQMRDISEEK
jgi:hypothetical protein